MRTKLATWAAVVIPMCAPLASCGTSAEPKTPEPVLQKQQPASNTKAKAKTKPHAKRDDAKLVPASRLMDESERPAPQSPGSTPLDDQNWGSVPWGEGAWGDGAGSAPSGSAAKQSDQIVPADGGGATGPAPASASPPPGGPDAGAPAPSDVDEAIPVK